MIKKQLDIFMSNELFLFQRNNIILIEIYIIDIIQILQEIFEESTFR